MRTTFGPALTLAAVALLGGAAAARANTLCGVVVEHPQRDRYIRHNGSSVNRHIAGWHILRAGILPGDRRGRD
jgi:hypothetical protein